MAVDDSGMGVVSLIEAASELFDSTITTERPRNRDEPTFEDPSRTRRRF